MKKILLAIVLVLAMAIPAFPQTNVPFKVRPLMIYTANASGPSATFSVGQPINCYTTYETKGNGIYRVRLDVFDSAGVLIDRVRWGNSFGDEPTWELWFLSISPNLGVPTKAGCYILKVVYTHAATGNTWSHQTKVHVN